MQKSLNESNAEGDKGRAPLLLLQRQERILSCLDKGLSCLGESAKALVYSHLAAARGIQPTDILKKPHEFVKGLEEMFGIGKKAVEEQIKREIIEQFPTQTEASSLVELLVAVTR